MFSSVLHESNRNTNTFLFHILSFLFFSGDKSTGKKQAITIQSSGGLSDAEIDRMVQEAEAKKGEDEAKKNAVTAKNEAESFIHTVEKQVSEFKDKISADDKKDVEEKIVACRTALASDDVEQIKEAKDALQQASWKISQAMYASGDNNSEGGEQSGDNNSSEEKKEGGEQTQQEERK